MSNNVISFNEILPHITKTEMVTNLTMNAQMDGLTARKQNASSTGLKEAKAQ